MPRRVNTTLAPPCSVGGRGKVGAKTSNAPTESFAFPFFRRGRAGLGPWSLVSALPSVAGSGSGRGEKMALSPRSSMTVQEYFQLEQSNPETCYEYIDGYVTMLADGTLNHATIAANVIITLGT